ncbi:beta-ketoacyl synthase [Streptomyces marincola]|uniref:Beta-ketoacyl synthase n=2 Tax=Streptomyces marincola TaxID=2878388 RepID=A0A1W7D5U0_9ACTN|nr:beta-ketoacyl synthase [Streptomyces marincola]
MAALLPGAPGLDAYWRNLVAGADCITDLPGHRIDPAYYPDPVYCRRGGFVDEFAEVEAARFGIMPNAVPGTEPDQLIALSMAADALDDAGGAARLPDRDRVGVVLGRGGYLSPGLARLDQRVRTAHQLTRTLGELVPGLGEEQLARVREAFTRRLGPQEPEHAIGLVPNLAASRLASRLDLRGPVYTVDAACASALVAVDQAVSALASGTCDVMLAGGTHHCHDITLWSVFAQLRALSPSQRSRPFHAGADGLLIGEGTGIVVLKRLVDAQRDGDRVYAVIRGTGVAGDGRAGGLVSPDSGGQARAVRNAWRAAGLDPRAPGALGLIEAHGTGTPAGDASELATLAEVFGPPERPGAQEGPVIGSVKSMIGHTMPAAGAAGLIKAALAVHHATLLPTLHCDEPHPGLARTVFRPLAAAAPWPGGPRRAAVNAFGFGGINAHVVIEQAPEARAVSRAAAPAGGARADGGGAAPGVAPPAPGGRRPAAVREPERVLRLAAAGPAALAALLDADDAVVRALPAEPADAPVAGGACRLGVVQPTAKRLALARRAVARGRAWRGRDDVWFSPGPLLAGPRPGLLAFVFPGLEAEFEPRGLDEVAGAFGLALPEWATADAGDTVRQGLGVLSVAGVLEGALRRMGVTPDGVAGHSVGEWSAMVAGGLYSRERSDRMLATFDPDSLTVPGLVFAALGTSADRVTEALGGRTDIVLSHDNSPRQTMVCGPEPAVEELVRWFRARRVLGRVLPFTSAFHTPMLAPHLAPLAENADRLEVLPATLPVWSATTAAPFPDDPAGVRRLFLRHLLEPVRFRPMIEAMHDAGYRVFVQPGTGQLTSLIDDTLAGREHLAVAANTPHRGGLDQLRRVALALWTEGARVEDPPGAAVPAIGTAPAVLSAGTAAPPSVAVPAAAPARAPGGAAARPPGGGPVRLSLGEPLVSLPPAERAALGALLRAAPGAGSVPAPACAPAGASAPAGAHASGPHAPAGAHAAASDPLAGLRGLARRVPAAAGLAALLAETADAAAGVLTAAAPPRPPEPVRSTLRISTRAMPYLLDHCFYAQPPGWPDLADRRPVVPATTIVQHMMDAVERAAPGLRATALHGVRFEQWADALPETTAEITVTPGADGAYAVAFGPYARARVTVAPGHPAPPAAWPPPEPGTERPCAHGPADLYADRWMFHGPAFQGVTGMTGLGERHIRGTITAPAAPGALLDNVGQLLGYWLMATRPGRAIVFPVAMDGIRFHGPPPAAGTRVECAVRVTGLSDTDVTADAQLTVGGRVWAEIAGWRDRRFDGPLSLRSGGYPERRPLSRPRPGGWWLMTDQWADLASRELVMGTQLAGEERAAYAARPARGRRAWLLGRLAAKDAVRGWLWEHGEGDVFPAEIGIRNDASGRPFAVGRHGRALPPLGLSLAHRKDVAVALVRPGGGAGGPWPGIDVEVVSDDTLRAAAVALGPGERALLDARAAAAHAADGGGEDGIGAEAEWFARFWAAKEAVAKAEGTGLRGRPRDFAVVEAAPGELAVRTGDRTHRVRCTRITHAARAYVVAWTAPNEHEENSE